MLLKSMCIIIVRYEIVLNVYTIIRSIYIAGAGMVCFALWGDGCIFCLSVKLSGHLLLVQHLTYYLK